MQKWEYDYMSLSTPRGSNLEWDVVCNALNKRGFEGWELVGIVNRLMLTKLTAREGGVNRTREFPVALLKRPLID